MLHDFLLQLLKWLWNQVDTLLALILAATCSILGLFGTAPAPLLASATLGTLTVLAIALMRDRSEREQVQSQLNQLLSQFNDPHPDAFFKHRTDETALLQDAEREVWIIQETGNFVLDTKKLQIVSLLQRGGIVRIVVVMPTKELLSLLAFRNDSLTPDAIKTRSNSFHYQVESVLRNTGANAERIQVRFIPYPVEVTSIIIDPQSDIAKKRKAIVRYSGFRASYDEKFDYRIQGDISPRVFSHYFREAQQIFEHASKIVLLTGAPRSGKTTMLGTMFMRLVERVSPEDRTLLFSVISRGIWNGSERIGFEAITSRSSTPRIFATHRGDGNYDIDESVWTTIATELEEAHRDRKIIILDEIGPMQLQSQAFVDAVEKIINDPIATMFATIALEDRTSIFLRKMKQHYRSTVLLLTSNEYAKSQIEKNLEQEMKASLYLATHIPNTLCNPM